MADADLSGHRLGRYQLVRWLGEGSTSVVYLATPVAHEERQLALKLLDPTLVSRPGFRDRFERDVRKVSAVNHQHVLPVYEYGTSDGYTFVATELAPGGSLRDRMAGGPMGPDAVLSILNPVADALHCAHQAGIVHSDVKPGNVLFDARSSAVVSDFGLARTNLGFAVGTPGYMAPEQAMGNEPDSRADVYALAVVIFEMLTGTPLWPRGPVPEMLKATVNGDVPTVGERRPELPAGLDGVLSRALARRPENRHPTTIELLWEVARVLSQPWGLPPPRLEPDQVEIATDAYRGSFLPAPVQPGSAADGHGEFERAQAHLMRIFDTALTASVAVDESSFITGWNAMAEETFGWTREEIVGRSLSSTLIPPQYREAHERGFKRFLETGEGPVLGKVIEITAMHRDGREFPIELSISPAARSGTRALFVAFARDITEQRRAEQLRTAREAVAEALTGARGPVGPAVAQAIGESLGWSVVVLWRVDGGVLRCGHLWKADSMESPDLEQAIAKAEFARDVGVPGRVWSSGDGVWVEDVLHEAETSLALPALRAGLRTAVGVPLLRRGEVRGVLELFGRDVQPADESLLDRLFDLGRKIGAVVREEGGGRRGERRETAVERG